MDILKILVQKGLLKQKDLTAITDEAVSAGITIEEALIKRGISPHDILEAKGEYFDIPSSSIELSAAKKEGTVQFSREEYREKYPSIDAMLFLKGYVTTIKTRQAYTLVSDIVQREGYDPKQLRVVKRWQQEQDKRKELGVEDETITLTDRLIMELLGMSKEAPEIIPALQKKRKFRFKLGKVQGGSFQRVK